MEVITETAHVDGSAWVAAVRVKGVVYRASYVNSTLTVGLGPYKHHPRRARWPEQAVRTWAEKRVKTLSDEWLALHVAMYAAEAEKGVKGRVCVP